MGETLGQIHTKSEPSTSKMWQCDRHRADISTLKGSNRKEERGCKPSPNQAWKVADGLKDGASFTVTLYPTFRALWCGIRTLRPSGIPVAVVSWAKVPFLLCQIAVPYLKFSILQWTLVAPQFSDTGSGSTPSGSTRCMMGTMWRL